MKRRKIYQIILMTFFGTVGSVLIGFIFLNTSIFITTRPSFQFVAGGFIGALYFSLLEYKSLREQIFGMIIILILHLIIFTGKHFSITYVIRDVLYLGGLFLSIKIYYQFIKNNPKVRFYLRSFVLALIYGLLNTVFGFLIYFINTKWHLPTLDFIYIALKFGTLIGFGIGIGTDFYFQNKKHLYN
ncbi:MAG: hypothetical protein P8Y81_09805, partial [Ignavibacteriaceae bacterium]